MCGRFTLTKSREKIEKRFTATLQPKQSNQLDFAPNYNIAPYPTPPCDH